MTDRAYTKAAVSQQLQAATMGAWQYDRRQDFTGGENRLLTPDFVAPNQVINAINCEITPEGVLQTRKGLNALNTSLGAGPIIAAFRYKKEDGSSYLVVQWGTALYSATYDGSLALGTLTSVKTGLTAGSKLRGVVWKDKLILTNGTENPFTFDGTTCTNVPGSPPKSKVIAVYGARLWLIPVATPNVIQCSGLETYSTWDALDVIKVRDGDGDTISALVPLDGGMVILKSNSVWPMYGTSRDDWRIGTAPMVDNVGCYGIDAVSPQAAIFMAKDGFYSFNLSSVTRLPRTHDTVLNAMADVQKRAAVCCHLSKENRALFAFPDSKNTVLNFDLNYGCITTWQGLNASTVIAADAAGDMQSFIVGDATNGVLNMLCSEDDDNGTPITTQIWTAYTDCGDFHDKVFRMFRPEFSPVKNLISSVVLYYDIDYKSLGGIAVMDHDVAAPLEWDESKWDKNVWGPVANIYDPLWIPNERGRRVSYGVKSTGRIKFLGYVTKFRPTGYL